MPSRSHRALKYPVSILLAIAVICPLFTMGVLVHQRQVERNETIAQTEQLRHDVAVAIELEVLGLWATTAQTTERVLADLKHLGIDDDVINTAFPDLQSTSGLTLSNSIREPRTQLERGLARLDAENPDGRLSNLGGHRVALAAATTEFHDVIQQVDSGAIGSDEAGLFFAEIGSEIDDAAAAQINEVFEDAAGHGGVVRDLAALQSILRAHRAVVVELEATASATGLLLPGSAGAVSDAARAITANAIIDHEQEVFRRVATDEARVEWDRFLTTEDQQRYAELRAQVPGIINDDSAPTANTGAVEPEFVVLGFNRMSRLVDDFVPQHLERITSELDVSLNATAAEANRASRLAVASALATVALAAISTNMLLRPLGKLRQRAHDLTLGAGGQPPLGPIGPREIATVALAMDDVSSNLNIVEGQLQAISDRDFEADVLKTRLPGAVGRSLENSMKSASESSAVLHRQARVDGLTGLPNRPEVLERLDKMLDEADEGGPQLAVVFMDLDRFKGVNDSLGHKAGDELLIEFARRLSGALGPDEFIGRIGGDEFLAVSQNISSTSEAVSMTERLLESVEAPFEVVGRTLDLNASAGITLAGAEPTTASRLLHEADLALYASKHASRRVTMCTAELIETAERQRTTMTAVEEALAADEFLLHLQPIVDLGTAETVAAEALLRWKHNGEFVPPAEYIPVVESTSLISEVGRWVLHEAARHIAHIRETTSHDLMVSVNISWNHVAYGSLVADVQSALRSANIPSRLLQLEFTESTPPPDVNVAARVLNELASMGVGLWLDDFGSGYTSITQLTELSFNTVKLDRSFIGRDSANGKGRLAESMIDIIKVLGIDVVVEGVEVEEERERMLAAGAQLGQGWLWSRDLPVDDLIATLEPRPQTSVATESLPVAQAAASA